MRTTKDINKLKQKSREVSGSIRIGEISRRTGVKVVTLRYYEAQGLLPKTSPARARHRRYSADIVARVELIRSARAAGLSIPETRSLLELLQGFKPPAIRKMQALREAISQIEGKIDHLQKMRQFLRKILENPSSNLV